MKIKYLALLAAMTVAGQSWALTAYEKQHGCNHEVGDCPNGDLGGGGGGGGFGNAEYYAAFNMDGALWEGYVDKGGIFYIETNLTTGKKTVHFGDNLASLHHWPTSGPMARSKLQHGPLTQGMSFEQAKKKDDEAKAKAAADAAKKAADAAKKAADAVGPISATPVGNASLGGSLTGAAPPSNGVSAGASAQRKKP